MPPKNHSTFLGLIKMGFIFQLIVTDFAYSGAEPTSSVATGSDISPSGSLAPIDLVKPVAFALTDNFVDTAAAATRVSPNGKCGGSDGFVCTGSLLGDCCNFAGFW